MKSPKKYFEYFVLIAGLGLEPWLLVTLPTRPRRLRIHTYFDIILTHYSYSKIDVLIILIFNTTYAVVDFDSPWPNIDKNHKISWIRIRTLQYSVEACVYALLAVFVFFFLLLFCKCNNNSDRKFWWIFLVIRIIYEY